MTKEKKNGGHRTTRQLSHDCKFVAPCIFFFDLSFKKRTPFDTLTCELSHSLLGLRTYIDNTLFARPVVNHSKVCTDPFHKSVRVGGRPLENTRDRNSSLEHVKVPNTPLGPISRQILRAISRSTRLRLDRQNIGATLLRGSWLSWRSISVV